MSHLYCQIKRACIVEEQLQGGKNVLLEPPSRHQDVLIGSTGRASLSHNTFQSKIRLVFIYRFFSKPLRVGQTSDIKLWANGVELSEKEGIGPLRLYDM